MEAENFGTEEEKSSSSKFPSYQMKMMSKPKNISHRVRDAGRKVVGLAGPVIQGGEDPDPIARYIISDLKLQTSF